MLRTGFSSRRRWPFVRLMLLFVWAGPATVFAQLPQLPGYESQAEAVKELSDVRLQRIYESALSIMERGDLVNGLPLLQSILDHPRDTLYYPDPQVRDQAVSLKGKVLETLKSLPASELDQYNVLYDPAAQEILKRSHSQSARGTLEDIVRRYYFTETGREAALRLAKMYFDRGNFLAAALTFQRLLEENRVPAKDRPLILLQTAVSLRLTGLDDKCLETLQQFEQEIQSETIKIGGQTYALKRGGDERLAWLDQMIAPGMIAIRQDPQADWTTFRGNSERNSDSSGAPPLREQSWEFRTIPVDETDDPKQLDLVEHELESLSEKFASSNYLQIPAMHPLIVGDRIVIRSLGNLKAIDLHTGEFLWESHLRDQRFVDLLEQALDSFVNRDEQISELQEYIMQHTWRDLSAGMLSSDGTYVYAAEELGLESPQQSRYGDQLGNNKLIAYELASGKLAWVLESPNNYQERFLGPPLVQGDTLYCLVERNEEILLVALKNREKPDGYTDKEILWEQPLPLPVSSELNAQMPKWKISGLTPSYANGMLVCPIAHGTVVAYDLARGILSWQYRYPGEQIPSRQTVARLNRIRDRYGLSREDEDRWIDSAPTIARGRILLTPCDSPELHCLNLSTGIPYWTIPRGDDLYVATVHDDQIVLVGRDQIHARRLDNGAELWSVPLPMPSGRGFSTGSDYHVPLTTAAIAVIDLQQGELRAMIPSQHNRVPGNLVAARGVVVSQTADRVFRYLTNEEMQHRLSEEGETVDSGVLRGELALLAGRKAEAVAEFSEAYQRHQSPRLRELLVLALLDALQDDFEEFDQYLPLMTDLTRGTPQYPVFQEIVAEGLSKSGDSVEAFSQFLSLLDQPLSRLDRRTSRIRSDVWARGQLQELYDGTEPETQRKIDQVVQTKVEQLLKAGNLNALTRAESMLQSFPGSLELQRARLAQLNEYTESLALELLLIRLSESADLSLRREAVGRHFQLLMKLERIEQAARVRNVLLERYADDVCVDQMTGAELAEWGLENRPLQEYLARRSHEWTFEQAVVTPTRGRPPNPSPDLYHIPIVGPPGLFAGWTFHLTNQKPPRLWVVDEFGKKRSEIILETARHEPANLSLNCSLHLQGHLGVLVLADQFYVLDLFQAGSKSFLHGPHQLNDRLAGLEMRDLRESVLAETVGGPNGHPRRVTRDLFNERLGQIAAVTTQMIVFQRDRELIAIDILTGEELWGRQIGDHGQLLAADGQIVACRPMGQRTVSIFRLVDGKSVGQFDLPERHYVFAVHGRLLITLEQIKSAGSDQPTSEDQATEDAWKLTAYDPLLQKAIWSRPASPRVLVQSADDSHVAVIDGTTRVFEFIRVEDGEVLAQHTIAITGRAEQDGTTETPDPPTPEKPGDDTPQEAAKAADIMAFWISNSRDGYLLTTVDRLNDGAVQVSSLTPDRIYHPLVHGEVLQLNQQGELLWQRRVENQIYDSEQPLESPVVVFLARHVANQRGFITNTNRVAIEILDRQTGEQLFQQVEIERHSQLETEVDPDRQQVHLIGNWNSYVISFGKQPSSGPAELEDKSP